MAATAPLGTTSSSVCIHFVCDLDQELVAGLAGRCPVTRTCFEWDDGARKAVNDFAAHSASRVTGKRVVVGFIFEVGECWSPRRDRLLCSEWLSAHRANPGPTPARSCPCRTPLRLQGGLADCSCELLVYGMEQSGGRPQHERCSTQRQSKISSATAGVSSAAMERLSLRWCAQLVAPAGQVQRAAAVS